MARRSTAPLALGSLITAVLLLTATIGPALPLPDPYAVDLSQALQRPSPVHPLGTDALGRDLLSRTVHGARLAVGIAFMGVGAGAFAGGWLGLIVGYRGGLLDRVTMRIVDVLLAFPGFLLALGAAAVLGPGTENLIIAVGFFSFPPFVRVARSVCLQLLEEGYVAAAKALGAGDLWVLSRHILVNAKATLMALLAIRMAAAVATASGLSFLGLGPAVSVPEWGGMLDFGREYLWIAPHAVIVPGGAVFLASLGFFLLGEGLRGDWSAEEGF